MKEKTKPSQYELQRIIKSIQWWLDSHGSTPTSVGAVIQRYAAEKLDYFHDNDITPCMDDLLERASGLLYDYQKIYNYTPGTVITWVPPYRPIEDFTTEELLSEIRDRMEYDGG